MAPSQVRVLHWVFKVADRSATIAFYKRLGLKVLRHEEFQEGCQAACNGPYDGRWSKTMIGYGDEDSNFVLELTYNYGNKHYLLGNDFDHMTIRSWAAWQNFIADGFGPGKEDKLMLSAPDGYKFVIEPGEEGMGGKFVEVALHVTSLQKSIDYWHGFLGFGVERVKEGEALLTVSEDQCRIRLLQLPEGQEFKRGAAFGRIAFSCGRDQLKDIEAGSVAAGYTVLTPFVSLQTPGKATVEVVILADPDGHEICFVGDEGFRQLSVVDPEGERILEEAIAADQSKEWFAKRNLHTRKDSYVKC